MTIDERALDTLIEESQDLHRDAMRVADASRRHVLQRGLLAGGAIAAGGLGAAALARDVRGARPAAAATNVGNDIAMLQTAASIEALAVSVYTTALTLPFIGGSSANPVVKKFVQTTKGQHQDHASAFNTALAQFGATEQMQPDPVLLKVVQQAKPTLTTPAAVVALAIQLEDGAAQTYVADTGNASDAGARKVFASIMGVEAQHVAVFLAVQALLNGGAPQLIALPPKVGDLPAAAGSVGFPNSFYKTTMARPATEGAVK